MVRSRRSSSCCRRCRTRSGPSSTTSCALWHAGAQPPAVGRAGISTAHGWTHSSRDSGHNSGMLVAGREVAVTNPDKMFFPQHGITKGDLVQYYVDVAGPTLNHVARRPMQMKRHPNGVDGDFFYQKRIPNPHPDWLETVHIQYPSGNEVDFPVVTDAAGLAWIANLGCIEMHTWHSRVDDVNRPDYLLIDLDPSEGNPWSHVREIAMAARRVLDDLGVASFPKTSGVTGLHILVPILPELEFPLVREIARAIAKETVKLVPT